MKHWTERDHAHLMGTHYVPAIQADTEPPVLGTLRMALVFVKDDQPTPHSRELIQQELQGAIDAIKAEQNAKGRYDNH